MAANGNAILKGSRGSIGNFRVLKGAILELLIVLSLSLVPVKAAKPTANDAAVTSKHQLTSRHEYAQQCKEYVKTWDEPKREYLRSLKDRQDTIKHRFKAAYIESRNDFMANTVNFFELTSLADSWLYEVHQKFDTSVLDEVVGAWNEMNFRTMHADTVVHLKLALSNKIKNIGDAFLRCYGDFLEFFVKVQLRFFKDVARACLDADFKTYLEGDFKAAVGEMMETKRAFQRKIKEDADALSSFVSGSRPFSRKFKTLKSEPKMGTITEEDDEQ